MGVIYIAKYFRRYFLPDLPGADEIEKFSLILKEAPPWLLWFTNADVEAYILGIELPDLSEVSCFARGKRLIDHLPTGPFELRPLPAPPDEFEDDEFEDKAKDMTPRGRKRMRKIYDTLR